jgi:hypothetical protein
VLWSPPVSVIPPILRTHTVVTLRDAVLSQQPTASLNIHLPTQTYSTHVQHTIMHARHRVFEIVKLQFEGRVACHLHSTVACCLPLAQNSSRDTRSPTTTAPAGRVLTQMSHHHVAIRYPDFTGTAEGPQGSDCPVTFPSSGNVQHICHRCFSSSRPKDSVRSRSEVTDPVLASILCYLVF